MYERIRFSEFLRTLQWRQGEHMFLAAQTQCGKTTLASYLVARRANVCVVGSKPKDENLKRRYADYRTYKAWPPDKGDHRVLLWPAKQRTLEEDAAYQRPMVKRALDAIGNQGGWCVVIDETHWTSQFLRLDKEIAILHHQGASSGITMVTLTQRPAWIPRIVYSSATHAFIGQFTQPEDLRTLAAMGGDYGMVKDTVKNLGRHDLLYINPLGERDPVIVNIRY